MTDRFERWADDAGYGDAWANEDAFSEPLDNVPDRGDLDRMHADDKAAMWAPADPWQTEGGAR